MLWPTVPPRSSPPLLLGHPFLCKLHKPCNYRCSVSTQNGYGSCTQSHPATWISSPSAPVKSFSLSVPLPPETTHSWNTPANKPSAKGWGPTNKLCSTFVKPVSGQLLQGHVKVSPSPQPPCLKIINPGGMFAVEVPTIFRAAFWLPPATQNNVAVMNIK